MFNLGFTFQELLPELLGLLSLPEGERQRLRAMPVVPVCLPRTVPPRLGKMEHVLLSLAFLTRYFNFLD